MDLLLLAYAVALGFAAGELIGVGIRVFPGWFSWAHGLDRSYREWSERAHRLRTARGFLTLTGMMVSVVRGRCLRCGTSPDRFRWSAPSTWAGGRRACAHCGYALAPDVLLPQLVVASLTTLVVLAGGLTVPTLLALATVWMWTCIAFISARSQLIPNALTLPLVWMRLVASALGVGIGLEPAVAGAVVGYLVPWSAYHAIRTLCGRELLGHGCFKATAAIGAMGGPYVALLAFAFACTAKVGENLLRHRRLVTSSGLLPMGPWLAAPSVVVDVALLRIGSPAGLG